MLVNVRGLCGRQAWPILSLKSFQTLNRRQACKSSKWDVSNDQLSSMQSFMDILLTKNKVMNLTAVTNREEAWKRHVEDSLALLPVLDQCFESPHDRSAKLIDIGSGGGIPGLIIALARPNWTVTLLDSLQKRCVFVEEAIDALKIDNATPVWARAETAGQQTLHREVYDLALARAVAEMRVLAELSLPFVKQGGYFVGAKGPNPQEEVYQAQHAISELGGELKEIMEIDSKAANGFRTAVVIAKTSLTPSKYPRKDGRPQKRPL